MKPYILLLTLPFIFVGCSKEDDTPDLEVCIPENIICPDFITDHRDSQIYSVVKIGCQCWMARNLNFAGTGTCYKDLPENCEVYGRLYTWEEAMNGQPHNNLADIKGICPDGWHLPSSWEFRELIDNAGGDSDAGRKLKADTLWTQNAIFDLPDVEPNGFNALPAGYFWGCCQYSQLKRGTGFISATRSGDSERAWHLNLWHRSHEVELDTRRLIEASKPDRNSCRCIKD